LGDAKKDKINPIEELVLLHKDKDSSFRYHYIQNDSQSVIKIIATDSEIEDSRTPYS